MDRKCLGLAGWPISWWHLPRCRGGSIRPWRSRWWNALIFGAPKIRKLYNCTACAAAGHWYIMIHHDTSCSQCFATTFVKYSALCEGTSEQEQWILDITITQAWTTKRHKRPVWGPPTFLCWRWNNKVKLPQPLRVTGVHEPWRVWFW